MEKLPQRPAIIDSLQRCTQLGTFTNKGRPINISHADRAGDRELEAVGLGEGVKIKEETELRHVMFGSSLALFFFFI